jgi:hypothetical protein
VMGKAAKPPAEDNNAGGCRKWESEGPIVARKGSKEPGAKGPWRIEQADSEEHGTD